MLKYTNCKLCARQCGLDRTKDKTPCKSDNNMRIARYALHHFEEPPISGTNGSGTVFFTGCSLNCVFCQNHEISITACGQKIDEEQLKAIFDELTLQKAHNINLVNPTHFAPSIISAVKKHKPSIPLVYNTHGYDSFDTISALDGIIDIYLPDIKYYDDRYAHKYSQAKNYFNAALSAVKQMCGQVKIVYSGDGIISSGVIIRHLILPGLTSDSIKILEIIKNELPSDITVSLMAQYVPCNDLSKSLELNRKITRREYDRVIDKMVILGLKGYIQNLSSSDKTYIPEWNLI